MEFVIFRVSDLFFGLHFLARVPLPNGGSLVIEQTEALVSVDVNGGHGMFGQNTSQEKAVLDVNLAAAKQVSKYWCFQLFVSIKRHAYIGLLHDALLKKLRAVKLSSREIISFT